MQSAFGTVVLVVCGIGAVAALAGLLLSARTWDEYRQHHLRLDSDAPQTAHRASAERDSEIRQLLEARNARRRRRGESEIDIDTELARLTASGMGGR